MTDLTLYELCGDDHYVIANLQKNGWVDIEVLDAFDQVVYKETSHPAAWESLVRFAKMVKSQDEKVRKQMVEFNKK